MKDLDKQKQEALAEYESARNVWLRIAGGEYRSLQEFLDLYKEP